jgi:hypothetical protein
MSGAMHPHNLSQQILTDQSVLVDTIIHAMLVMSVMYLRQR